MRAVAGDQEGVVGAEVGLDGRQRVRDRGGCVGEVVDAGDAGGGGEVGVFGLSGGWVGQWVWFFLVFFLAGAGAG